MGVEVLRIDRQGLIEFRHRILVFALQKKHAAHLVSHHPVARVQGGSFREFVESGRVVAVGFEGKAGEVVRAGEPGIKLDGLFEQGFAASVLPSCTRARAMLTQPSA